MLPDIYLFNPTCEYAVANGTVAWQPNRLLQQMEADLGTLPLFFTQPKDFLLVKKLPSNEFLHLLKQLNIESPTLLNIDKALTDKKFLSLPKGKLLPWGWSPAVHHLLSPIKETCSYQFKAGVNAKWKPEYKEMYSKKTAAGILKQLLISKPSEHLITDDFIPRTSTLMEEIELLNKKWGKLMVKAPWSSSGRGLQPVNIFPIHPSIIQRIQGIINEQGFVMVEPLFDKLFDFSFQYQIQNGKATFLGISFFLTDLKGQYKGTYLNGLPDDILPEIKVLIKDALLNVSPALISFIERSNIASNYEGILGVDALIIKDSNGNLTIHPCLEMNLRQNMGILSFYLQEFISPLKKGMFKIFHEQGKHFSSFAEKMAKKYPPVIIEKKLTEGFFPLTDPFSDALFGAYFLIK